jgi:hypothetical protein
MAGVGRLNMTINSKKAQASDGTDVDTGWWEVDNPEGPIVIEVSAQYGVKQVNHVITVGPTDSFALNTTKDSLQAQLDAARRKVADIAVSQSNVKQLLTQLV